MQSRLRSPRALVSINGQATPWESWEVDSNTFQTADTARVVIPVSRLIAATSLSSLLEQPTLSVEIQASEDGQGMTTLFRGNADTLRFAPGNFQIELACRDRTADLIAKRTTEKFQNRTSSQVATQIAAEAGLTPAVEATSELVGNRYTIDRARTPEQRTLWDLLTWLAREEGFVVFVRGDELHFRKPPDPGAARPFEVVLGEVGKPPQANAARYSFERVLTLANDIKVEVRSWNHKQKKGFTKTAGRGSTVHAYTFGGLSEAQAQNRADQLHAEISKHQMRLTIDGPADAALTQADAIAVTGAGAPFDQVYYIDSIRRRMDARSGFVWTIDARNVGPVAEQG